MPTVLYTYDPLDRLIQTAGIRRFYNSSRMATEIEGTVQRSVFQVGDHVLAEGGAGGSNLLATDLQRSVLHTVNPDKTQPIAYNVYGHRPAESGVASVLGFNGERADPVTGHYLLGNGYRAFNPVLMRFNSPDSWSPFGRGGVNAYGYCGGNPGNYSDPSGHLFVWARNAINAVMKRKTTVVDSAGEYWSSAYAQDNVVYENIKKIQSGVYVADEIHKIDGLPARRLVIDAHGIKQGYPLSGRRVLSNKKMLDLLRKNKVDVANYNSVHMISCFSAVRGKHSLSAKISLKYKVPTTAYMKVVAVGLGPKDIWRQETRAISWLERGMTEVRSATFLRSNGVDVSDKDFFPVVFNG